MRIESGQVLSYFPECSLPVSKLQAHMDPQQLFRQAVEAVLKNWTALQLAVSQGAAGAQSEAVAQWTVDATTQWFAENQDLEPEEVADFLEGLLNRELDVLVQDGSTDEVAGVICDLHRLVVIAGDTEGALARIRTLPRCDLSGCQLMAQGASEEPEAASARAEVVGRVNGDPLSNGVASMDVADEVPPRHQPIVDEDGFTLVSRKKTR